MKKIKLTMPNDLNYLPVALNSINSMAKLLEFKKKDIAKIELGSEEAISNVIKHAFEPGEEESFDICLEPDTLGLNIIIKEKGIPYDPDQVTEYNPTDLSKHMSDKGLGTYLMKSLFDKVSFHNLGKEGKETHLFKYQNTNPIEKRLSKHEIAIAEKEKSEEVLPKGSVSYEVRRMNPEEAIDISKGAYSSYGYSYVLEHIYYPERVREMNVSNELISFVCVTESAEVIAHCALEEELDPLTPQLGVAFTKPKYRGQGCLNKLADACIEDAKSRGFYGIYARGVTTHPYSQKSLLKFDINDCAIYLSSGAIRQYKGMESHKQRESVVIHFRYMQSKTDFSFYVPSQHLNIIEKIYRNIGGHPILKLADQQEYPDINSEIQIQTDGINQVGKIWVKKQGKNTVFDVMKNLKALCIDRMETIYLYLLLDDPTTPQLCKEMEKHEFFFSGIMPASNGKDALVLQYLNNHVLDYKKIIVASDFGNELLDYIKTQDPNQ